MPAQSTASVADSSASSVIAPEDFNETNADFYVFTVVHCRVAALVTALTGIFAIVGTFALLVSRFSWYRYETTVDVIALLGVSVFLVSGVLVHCGLVHAVQKNKLIFLNPFLLFHGFLLLIEVVMALIAVGELVSDQEPQEDESDVLAREILLVVPLVICAESLMLYCVLKFRTYLVRRMSADDVLA
ncbi:Protein F58A6.2, partial [Aphelenchoides avenae]